LKITKDIVLNHFDSNSQTQTKHQKFKYFQSI